MESPVAGMAAEEKGSLAEALMRMVGAELTGGGENPARYPLCRCERFVRKGHDADGPQRWLCGGRTFGRKTMRVIAQSKLGEGTWMSYAEGMADGLTFRQLAERCGTCPKASWC